MLKIIISCISSVIYNKVDIKGDSSFKSNWLYLHAQLVVETVGRTFYQMVGDTAVISERLIALKLAILFVTYF